jgi:hypothetical protein
MIKERKYQENKNKIKEIKTKKEMINFIEEENFNNFVIKVFKGESHRSSDYKRLKFETISEVAFFLNIINNGNIDDLYFFGGGSLNECYSTHVVLDDESEIDVCIFNKDYFEYWNNL